MRRRRRLLLVVAAVVALGLVPVLAPPFYANLLVPFYGYAIALLGFNLLFGYAACSPSATRMFLGLGAYGAAVIAGVWGIKEFEIVLIGAALGRARRGTSASAGSCVRYTGIFFGMLTLAFGMLAHSVLFKFYHLTGGDSGMRVPRMRLLGLEFAAYNKIELMAGPFYYYCLALMVIAASPHVAHRALPVRVALALAARQRAEGRVPGRARAPIPAGGFRHLRGLRGHRRRHPRLPHRPCRPRARYWTHSGHLVFMTVLGGFSSFLGPIVGALALTLLQDQLQSYTQYWRFVLGAILAAVVIFLPRGLAGLVATWRLVGRRKAEAT